MFVYQGHRVKVKVKVTPVKNGIKENNQIQTFTCGVASIKRHLCCLSADYTFRHRFSLSKNAITHWHEEVQAENQQEQILVTAGQANRTVQIQFSQDSALVEECTVLVRCLTLLWRVTMT